MILRYVYSACIVVQNDDLVLCCDPWFSQGIYDGSWYQYPEVEDPVGAIGPVDHVYVSHIHPDHYDPPFLRRLLEANEGCRILVGSENQDFLVAKMRRDGFDPVPTSRLKVGGTEIGIFPNTADPEINVDSALVVKDSRHVIVNMNDCPFDALQVERIIEFCGRPPDLACLPYAGAGPYPQAYRFDDAAAQEAAADHKKEQFLRLFGRYLEALEPSRALPFAGLYHLGGKRSWMNPLRGIPDAVEVAERFGDTVVVLEERHGSVDLGTGEVSHARTVPHDEAKRDAFLRRFEDVAYPYEGDPAIAEPSLVRKLGAAHERACARIEDKPPGWICFKTPSTRFMCVRSDEPGVVEVRDSLDEMQPREEIYLDDRLLGGLLDRRYHWNNAEIGSHFEFRRFPERYDRRVYNLLNFLHA